MAERVCAIVVTFNRKDLLRKCLEALARQRRPIDGLVVVDNASTDGTPAVLAQARALALGDFQIVALPKNIGGAGGFNAGLARAYAAGYDRYWLMDDDGEPDADCLRALLEAGADRDFLGPLVVSNVDPTQLARRLRCPRTLRTLTETADAIAAAQGGLIADSSNPFNGTLISRRLVDAIGLPKAEMFIWGDEVEYELRARKAGFQVATVVAARHIHPPEVAGSAKALFGRFEVMFPENRLRMYCRTRNYGYIFSRHGQRVTVIKDLVKATLYCVSARRWGDLAVYYQALTHGLIGDFRHHTKFL